jgi:hypothetical protein
VPTLYPAVAPVWPTIPLGRLSMGRFSGEGMCKPDPCDGVSLVTLETSTLLVVGFL